MPCVPVREAKKMKKNDKEIREWLHNFANRILDTISKSNAYSLKKELDDFVKENGVTADQMQEFAESGAGEELYMFTC